MLASSPLQDDIVGEIEGILTIRGIMNVMLRKSSLCAVIHLMCAHLYVYIDIFLCLLFRRLCLMFVPFALNCAGTDVEPSTNRRYST